MMPVGLFQNMLVQVLAIAAGRTWWELIEAGSRLMFSIVLFFVNLLVLTVVLYLAGLAVVGRKRALLTDAFLISLLGTMLSTAFFLFIPYSWLSLVLSILAWLFLIKRLYETGWFGAIAVGIVAIVIFLVVAVILAAIFGILGLILESFLSLTI